MNTVRRYAPFLLALTAIALISRVSFVYGLIAVFAGLGFVLRFVPARVARRIVVQRTVPSRAFPGDRLEVVVTVTNSSRIPALWVDLDQAVPVYLRPPRSVRRVVSIGPRGEAEARYELACHRRGIYVLDPPRATTGDLFGLAEFPVETTSSNVLVVYPRVVPLGSLSIPSRSPLAALRTNVPLFADPARVGGIRDYQMGDSTRLLHWTASAATGRLMVKQFDSTVARDTLIVLDIDRRDYSRRARQSGPELAITVAASVATHVVEQERLPVGLLTEAIDGLHGGQGDTFLPAGRGRSQLMDILEMLARAVPPQTGGFVDLLGRHVHELDWGATILVVTGSVPEELAAALSGLRRAGVAVGVTLVQGDDRDGSTLRLDRARLPWTQVRSESDLEVVA